MILWCSTENMFAVPTKMLRYFQVASHINTYFWTPQSPLLNLKPTASLSFWPTAWFSSITCWKYTPLLRNATYSHVKTAGKHLSNRLINFRIVFAFTKTKYWRQLPSVLWRCWLGGRKGIQPVKKWVVGCWHGYLSGARCRLAYGPADSTATHCLLFQ